MNNEKSIKPFQVRVKSFVIQICNTRFLLNKYNESRIDCPEANHIKYEISNIFDMKLLAQYILKNETIIRKIIPGNNAKRSNIFRLDELISEAKEIVGNNQSLLIKIKQLHNDNS